MESRTFLRRDAWASLASNILLFCVFVASQAKEKGIDLVCSFKTKNLQKKRNKFITLKKAMTGDSMRIEEMIKAPIYRKPSINKIDSG